MISKIIDYLYYMQLIFAPKQYLKTARGKYALRKWSNKIIKRDKVCAIL